MFPKCSFLAFLTDLHNCMRGQQMRKWRGGPLYYLGQSHNEGSPRAWVCRLTKAHGQRYLPGAVHVAGVVAGEARAQDHPLHLFHCAPTLCCDNETRQRVRTAWRRVWSHASV